MVEARKDDDERPVADNAAADLSRFADASSKLFAEQATAMAVMTAYGITVAAQMTSMMLGAFSGPAAADDFEEPEPAEEAPSAKVVPLRPRAAKVTETETAPPAEGVSKPVTKAVTPVKAKARSATPLPVRQAPRRAAKPADVAGPAASGRGDDLKKISGIGPRLEQVLNERGITRYTDIAALSKVAVKKLDGDLGLEGRVIRDDWAGQAKALSGGKG